MLVRLTWLKTCSYCFPVANTNRKDYCRTSNSEWFHRFRMAMLSAMYKSLRLGVILWYTPLREPRTLSMLYLTVSPVPALYLALLHLHPAFHSAISHTPCLSSPLAFYSLSPHYFRSHSPCLSALISPSLYFSLLSPISISPRSICLPFALTVLPSVTLFYLSNSIFILSLSFCSLSPYFTLWTSVHHSISLLSPSHWHSTLSLFNLSPHSIRLSRISLTLSPLSRCL